MFIDNFRLFVPPMPVPQPCVLKLSCAVQSYAWGRKGEASAVARFAKSADPGLEISSGSPYAELWMGTHTNAPSTVDPDGGTGAVTESVDFGAWLRDNPESLGADVGAAFSGELPFLFKVLSVGTALSIQVG